jgi:hypothetical protein
MEVGLYVRVLIYVFLYVCRYEVGMYICKNACTNGPRTGSSL